MHSELRSRLQPILVTGGSGFIGSNFILEWLAREETPLVNLDALTYAANPLTLEAVAQHPRYIFVHGDIGDAALLARLFAEHRFSAVVHFAAESHVDRSILAPAAFLTTNILGTYELLQAARAHYEALTGEDRERFRFLHVSTDEVFGALTPDAPPFTEATAYAPNSPYAASKAASDHLARVWHTTYGLPVLVTNCSNNYGPYQFPEKLIPLVITQALRGEPLPVYGDGQQVRDWVYVADHCEAIRMVLAQGQVGQTYAIGGGNQPTNLELVRSICALLDELRPRRESHADLIRMVEDRPGHDRRYAIDHAKITRELGWAPSETLATGLRKTVEWYLASPAWVESVLTGAYRTWMHENYDGRLQQEADR